MQSAQNAFTAAMTLVRQGKLAEAEGVLRQVLANEPQHAGAAEQLGIVNFQLGRPEEAVRWLSAAVEWAPGSESTWNNLGVILESLGRSAEAAAAYGRALELNPQRAVLHFNLGNALRSLGRASEAEEAFRNCLRLDERHAQAWHNWGVLRREMGDRVEAERLLRRAVALAPEMVDAQVNLGSALQVLGRDEEALDCYREALRLSPGYADALAGEVSVLDRLGRAEEACEKIKPLLEHDQENADVRLTFASLARSLGEQARARALLEELVQRNDLPLSKREAALFALGKLCDAEGQYNEAFAWYQQANECRPHPFPLAEYRAANVALRQTFTAELTARLPRAEGSSELPVFVVGMPRSGTSLVEQILASHHEVYGAGELAWLDQFSLGLSERARSAAPYPECVRDLSVRTLSAAAGEYLALLRASGGEARRVVDKMPGNFAHLPLVQLLFPKARVIHITREPLDNCLSCYFQNFTDGHHYAANLQTLGGVYGEYTALMANWRSVLSLPLLEIRYEELVADVEGVSRRMLDFCGLPWDANCLRFHETKRVVRTASYFQVRQPIYRRSVERWRRYEGFLGELKRGLATA